MDTNESQDRPTIPANTRLAALAVDVGGMVEAAIGVLANLGDQIGTRFPQLSDSDQQEPSGRPRPPVADVDGCRMAIGLREAYMLAARQRILDELAGKPVSSTEPPAPDDEPGPDLEGPGSGD